MLGNQQQDIVGTSRVRGWTHFLWDTESGLTSANPAHRKILVAGKIVFRFNFLLHADFITGKIVFLINLV